MWQPESTCHGRRLAAQADRGRLMEVAPSPCSCGRSPRTQPGPVRTGLVTLPSSNPRETRHTGLPNTCTKAHTPRTGLPHMCTHMHRAHRAPPRMHTGTHVYTAHGAPHTCTQAHTCTQHAGLCNRLTGAHTRTASREGCSPLLLPPAPGPPAGRRGRIPIKMSG